MNPDLKVVFDAIKNKRARYDVLEGYYSGDQPTVYLTQRLREIFRPLDTSFNENWCSVVIDACSERIVLKSFEAKDGATNKILSAAWDRNQIANEASDIHVDSLVLGESFAIVWPDANNKADIFYNDPRMVHAIYSESDPRLLSKAGKLWEGVDGKAKMTLYYPDHLEYYTSTGKFENVSSARSFVPDTEIAESGQDANPYEKVPVFHFKINRHIVSDLMNTIPLQNGINKLLSDMMVAAEFGAYSQRWVISQADTGDLKNAPGEVWGIPAGDGVGQDTSVGQFSSTDLKNYLDAVDRLSAAVGSITRTPKHYFFAQGGDPSGEALIALEAPLNKKAQDRIDRFFPTWRQLAAFACLIEGTTVAPEDITPLFARPETIQPKTQAEIVKISVDSGLPLDVILLRSGWTQAEIDNLNKLKDAEKAKSQASLANALIEAERNSKNQPRPRVPGQTVPPEGSEETNGRSINYSGS